MMLSLSIIPKRVWKYLIGEETKTHNGGLIILQNLTMKIRTPIIDSKYTIVMDYRPYSPEWHRRRYLKEALDKYFDDYVDTDVIRADILDILSERSEQAYREFMRINELERALQ